MAERHLLLVKTIQPDGDAPGDRKATVLNTVSLGRLADLERKLASYNCGRDGSVSAMNILYGPGITMQMPMVDRDDPVMQIMVSLNDETIAWSVLERICRTMDWKMMDPKTGSVFGVM